MLKDSGLIDGNYYYNTELFDNLPDNYLSEFKIKLAEHQDYETIKDNFIIDEVNNRLIQIHEKILLSELEELSDEEKFFYPLCDKPEIRRIFNVKNSNDYLLKFRAEQVINNPRINRVFDSIRRKQKNNWNFSEFLDTKLFDIYLEYLPKTEKDKCRSIPHGSIHLNDANGYCIKTPYGNVVVISFALRHFLYYMNLFHFGKQLGLNSDDIIPAFILAVRIMIGKEALDFEIDSRGEIPAHIHTEIDIITEWQMLFVIGHEYAHHYLNHLGKGTTTEFHSFKNREFKYYNFKQQKELEADVNSIIKPLISEEERSSLADAAFTFFYSLDLYQTVEEYMFPSSKTSATHPEPNDRILELRKNIDKKYGFSEDVILERINYYQSFKEELINDFLPFNIERIETYGSVYLPTYKKEVIHDRLL